MSNRYALVVVVSAPDHEAAWGNVNTQLGDNEAVEYLGAPWQGIPADASDFTTEGIGLGASVGERPALPWRGQLVPCEPVEQEAADLKLIADGLWDLVAQEDIEAMGLGAEYDDHELQNVAAVMDAAQRRLSGEPKRPRRTTRPEPTGKHLVTLEIDTERDAFGCAWGANFTAPKLSTSAVLNYAQTFGAESGAQWDHPPFTRVVGVEPIREGGETPGQQALRELAEGTGYSADVDDVGGIEKLIDYKNALEDLVREAIDGPSPKSKAEPAYTVVGTYEGDEGDRFAEVFYTHEGPRGAEVLARQWAASQHEDIGPDDVTIAAVVAGQVEVAR